jgi:hypothetical protein
MADLPCVKCKKKIDHAATICPYCRSVFTPDEVAARLRHEKVSKREALQGCAIFLVLFGLFVWWMSPSAENDAGTSAASEASPAGLKAMTEGQEASFSIIQGTAMQLIVCTNELDVTQTMLDGINRGEKRPIDAYSAAQAAVRDCTSAARDMEGISSKPLVGADQIKIYEKTRPFCILAITKARAALQTAQSVFDGEEKLATAQRYKDLRVAAKGNEVACKMGLSGLADSAKIPKENVDFLALPAAR